MTSENSIPAEVLANGNFIVTSTAIDSMEDLGENGRSTSTNEASSPPVCLLKPTVSGLIRQMTNPATGAYPNGIAPKELFDHIRKMPEQHRISKTRNHLQVRLSKNT